MAQVTCMFAEMEHRRVCEHILEGMAKIKAQTLQRSADDLNGDSIPTATGKTWSSSGVRAVLNNQSAKAQAKSSINHGSPHHRVDNIRDRDGHRRIHRPGGHRQRRGLTPRFHSFKSEVLALCSSSYSSISSARVFDLSNGTIFNS